MFEEFYENLESLLGFSHCETLFEKKLSQAAACDGNFDQISLQNDKTNPPTRSTSLFEP